MVCWFGFLLPCLTTGVRYCLFAAVCKAGFYACHCSDLLTVVCLLLQVSVVFLMEMPSIE